MRSLRNIGFLAVAVLLAAWPAASQFGVPSSPDFRGVFNPVVGSGASYQMEGKNGKSEMELTIVGKEDVNGKTGYWVEMAMNPPGGRGQMYAKNLMVLDGANSNIVRMIVQPPGQAPMDMTSMMSLNREAQTKAVTDARTQAERVGSENVTTPAGTFDCEHYKAKDGTWEAWLSNKVTPWGLVKSTGKDTTMMLTKVITNATDHITGTPQKFDIPGGYGRPGAGQQPPQR